MSAQKLTITIPEDLSKRLEKVRDNFNISGICQEALTREIQIQELATDLINDESVFERLKLQKAKNELTSEQVGKQEGATLARGMSYLLLDHLCSLEIDLEVKEAFEQQQLTKSDLHELIDDKIHELPKAELTIIGMDQPFDWFIEEKAGAPGLEFVAYIQGFLSALDAFMSSCIKKGLFKK